MKSNPTWLGVAVAVFFVVAMGVIAWKARQDQAAGEQLIATIEHVPIGSTAEEADRIMGSPPDRIDVDSGIMVEVTNLMSSMKSKGPMPPGVPRPSTARVWKRGQMEASVIMNPEGRVVGRSNGKPRQ